MSITFDRLHLRVGNFELRADFQIQMGQKIALLGPSGGGKSTLLSALAGFTDPVSGEIRHHGKPISNLPPAKRPVTLLFQDHNLFPHMSVAQNIGLGLDPGLRLDKTQKLAVQDSLARVGLQGQGDKLPSQLSGGQQQRVAIARALLRNQPVLLLDEPFAALGPALKREMLDLVDEIVSASQTTLLMVTHQPEDAAYLADQTVLIADGVARAPVPTQQLFDDPPPALQAYLGNPKQP